MRYTGCRRAKARAFWLWSGLLLSLGFNVFGAPAGGPTQFDVFLGHDGLAADAAWFPFVIEVKNDGESFKGVVEITGGGGGVEQYRMMELELPTGTLKRLVIPAFMPGGGYSTWDVRLRNSKGKVVAEHRDLRPRAQLAPGTPFIGSFSRTSNGGPQIRAAESTERRMQPAVARLLPALFPERALELEGLTCVYLNSDRAADLSPVQASALTAWIKQGGRLVVAIEELQHVEASPWLKEIVPCEFTGFRSLKPAGGLQEWLTGKWELSMPVDWETHGAGARHPGTQRRRGASEPVITDFIDAPFADLEPDASFENSEMRVAACSVVEGNIEVGSIESPLIISKSLGVGEVVVLLFSPEREPVRSWANLPVFWARLARVPPEWYGTPNLHPHSGWSTDVVFGAILDTRQARTLPGGWLLLLCLGYLAVIGPVDYLLVRRLKRPMLTWITFPGYVVAFSALIYFIGFKLRAGELEWNELHIVDVIESGGEQSFRGRIYGSLYSPVNKSYEFEGPPIPANFRGESAGGWRMHGGVEAVMVRQRGESFSARGEVPVWSSQLFACDWTAAAPPPFEVVVSTNASTVDVRVRNRSGKTLGVSCFSDGKMFELGEVGKGESRVFTLQGQAGKELATFQRQLFPSMEMAAGLRNVAFGRTEGRYLDNWPGVVQTLSIPTRKLFVSPPGLSLGPAALSNGGMVVFVWAEGISPVETLAKFEAKRKTVKCVWRVIPEIPRNQR
jgi:hypothetical protein